MSTSGLGYATGGLASSLAVRFAALAGIALVIVMAASGYVGSQIEASALREQVERHSVQLTELAAAEVANDVFTFAVNDLEAKVAVFRKDPAVRHFEIKDKTGKTLAASGAAGESRMISHTREVRAGGQVIGTVTLGLSMESVDRAVTRSWWLLLGREAVGLLILWVVLFLLIRRIVGQPLRAIAQVAGSVAEGDLTRRFAIHGRDEIAQTGAAFNSVLQRFHDIVAQVRSSAETVTVGAGQINTGNTNLSSRTEEQASSLEETAATLEEFSATTKQNAEAAGKANDVAQSAAQVATRGGTAVGKVVSTMGEISANSKQIVDITSVIDGIAFQTNILALNAAVEAARAGEHGRGFAVVAAEVRALAQRSGDAAKQIKSLLDSSVRKVTDGANVAQDAGRTIAELVAQVEKVGEMMASIAGASREQSVGIQQLNQTISQMETMVQQNAAVVQQAAAAASSLELQADGLLAIVSGFQVAKPADRPVDARSAPAAPSAVRAHAASPPHAGVRGVPRLQAATRDAGVEWREF